MTMQAHITVADGCANLRLVGCFDFAAHQAFRAVMVKAIDSAALTISIDLGQVDYIDSAALGMLLSLRERASNKQMSVRLIHPSGIVNRVLEAANFQNYFIVEQ